MCSSSEAQVLAIAASIAEGSPVDLRDALSGLDDHNLSLVAEAVAHAGGRRVCDRGDGVVSSVVVTRHRHPFEGHSLVVLGQMRRHGAVELLVVLPDGSKTLVAPGLDRSGRRCEPPGRTTPGISGHGDVGLDRRPVRRRGVGLCAWIRAAATARATGCTATAAQGG